MNFNDNACREEPRRNVKFGLCDNQDGSKAYSDHENGEDWIATVINDRGIDLVFTAVDKCVIKDGEYVGRGRCDGMLTSAEHLFFVELKDKRADWRTEAIEQLESTIQFYLERFDAKEYRHKKAFACNKQHPHFQEIDNELNLKWFRQYGFRLDTQAEIIMV